MKIITLNVANHNDLEGKKINFFHKKILLTLAFYYTIQIVLFAVSLKVFVKKIKTAGLAPDRLPNLKPVQLPSIKVIFYMFSLRLLSQKKARTHQKDGPAPIRDHAINTKQANAIINAKDHSINAKDHSRLTKREIYTRLTKREVYND